ncbi:MAG: hypothetical protein A2855_00945 [Candidatus Liptonbacteria bacterium RIFCSPHIGHO2_01_FULL_57_28]|uniref:Uncharacterized protein n=1 Tax=Candidatus Liptonbacteria bacterium RIFCSPHIGHO2_01_FULL_57_28 TaxID=1798647 RepID=A0A1G2CA32_9BACT|nr:MAG: hypothetical protein A2855_00945 [Candidatus Liptonbacteria bacterium RIFCSPHIGHO2_01_FULL_57_28]
MNSRGGYIALMSAIIIAVVLMGLLTTLSFSGFFGRFNILYSEFKEYGLAVTEGCANAVMIELGRDPSYTGDETLTFGEDTCQVFLIDPPVSGEQIIQVQVIHQDTYSNLEVTVNPTTLAVVAFEEVPNLP